MDYLLISRFKLTQEAGIVLGEHAQVLDLILQVGDTFDAHAEGVARVLGAVDAVELEDVGVNHAAAQDFYPTGTLAERTALAAADVARDVHLGARLGEGEVGGTETDLGVGTEHLLGKE